MWRAMRTHGAALTGPVRALALMLQLCFAAAAAPTELMFNFTSTRYSWATYLHLSELRLFDASGNPIAITLATNPGGSYGTAGGQKPSSSIDGNLESKWTDINFNISGNSGLYLKPADGSNAIASCEYQSRASKAHASLGCFL